MQHVFSQKKFFLSAETEEITILGFTFFTTNYVEGYDPNVTSDSKAVRKVKEAGHHSPEREAAFIKGIIDDSVRNGRSVTVGSKMAEAMHLLTSRGVVAEL